MQLTGYPDLLSFSRQSRITAGIKSRLEVVAGEAVTGIHADITKVTGGNVGGAHLLKKALNDISQNARLNGLSSARLQSISQALSGAREAVDGIDVRAIIALGSGSSSQISNVTEEADANLRSVMSALSGKHGSRNLLSGDATDTPPYAGADALLADVRAIMTAGTTAADIEAALDTYFNDPTGGFQTDQYLGGLNPASPLHLSNAGVIEVDVRGDNAVIKDVLRGLATLATAESSGFAVGGAEFSALFNTGITATADGVGGLIAMEGDLGIYAQTIDKADARDRFESASLSAAYQAIVGRDQFEAAAELKQLQVQLESSYILTSRMADLTLTNYIR